MSFPSSSWQSELATWELEAPAAERVDRQRAAERIRQGAADALAHGYATTWDLSDLSTLTSLPSTLPGDLAELNLSGCANLLALPPLPDSLQSLNLNGCARIAVVPTLAAPL